MKKLFYVLLSVLVFSIFFTIEGGSLFQLIEPTVILVLSAGVLLSTLFSFSITEIIEAFKDSFSEGQSSDRFKNYHKGLLVIRNLSSTTIFWAWTVVIMATILILSNLTSPAKLGPSFAVALFSLIYSYGIKALLFIPMEHSIKKKILNLEETQKS